MQRFWDKVNKLGNEPDDCWEWTASTSERGYGRIGFMGKTVKTHRLSYELEVGPIPEGLCVLHKCDNPTCVRPSHLFTGTKADNTDDMVKKGRHRSPKGERNGVSKLTEANVLEIRAKYEGGATQRELGKEYGVHSVTIHCIVNRKTWKHI